MQDFKQNSDRETELYKLEGIQMSIFLAIKTEGKLKWYI